MRCILHTANIRELLSGKAVTICRKEFYLAKDYQDRDILDLYVKNKEVREKYVIFFDTDSMELKMMERAHAWPRKEGKE